MQASISLFIGYGCNDYDESASSISQILDSVDGIWVVSAMNSAMNLHQLIESQDRDVRLPQTLIDSAFVGNLRSGTALSSLYGYKMSTNVNFSNFPEIGMERCKHTKIHLLIISR